jgi:hypothetical protein
MNDDVEPRLRDHLRHRAGRIAPAPDITDLHHRITERQRRRGRTLGAALALALVAGPVAGWAAGRASVEERSSITASGPGTDLSGRGAGGGGGVAVNESGPPHLEDRMQLVSERTTAEGLRLVVRSTGLGSPDGDPCEIDGLVRVGVVDGELVDVAVLDSAPSSATFGVAGGADGRPLWVVVARSSGPVEATFPNGTVDATAPVDGIAVLAAYAAEGVATSEPFDIIEVRDLPAQDGAEPALARPAGTGCTVSDPQPAVVMPEPGEPPADEDAARAEVEALFTGFGGGDLQAQMGLHERPNVWLDAEQRFRQEHPDYFEWAKETYVVPLEVVFTAPDRATVRYDLRSDNPDIPVPGERVGEAVLIDGVWKTAIETACADLGLAGIECDFSIEG